MSALPIYEHESPVPFTFGVKQRGRTKRQVGAGTPVVVYARISDDKEKLQLGVGRQTEECLAMCERRGWVVVGVYSDPSVSALRRKRRPGWEQVQRVIESGGAHIIVAWHPDRVTRNTRELEELIAFLEEANVPVHTVEAGDYDLSTASGRMAARVVGAVATHESEHKGERLRSKNMQRAKQGEPRSGGRRPFGYTDSTMRVIVPEEAAVVREIYKRVIAGEGYKRIATDLNARGVRTSRDAPWYGTQVRAQVLSPRHAALVVFTDPESGVQMVTRGKWTPIIDRATWDEANRAARHPSRAIMPRGPKVQYLFTGLVHGPDGPAIGKTDTGARTYGGGGISVREEQLDAIVLDRLFRRAREGSFIPSSDAATEKALRSIIDAAEAKLAKFKRDTEAELLDYDTFIEWSQVERDKRDVARQQLDALALAEDEITKLLREPDALERRWVSLLPHEKRAFVRGAIRRIDVAKAKKRGGPASALIHHPERVKVRFR